MTTKSEPTYESERLDRGGAAWQLRHLAERTAVNECGWYLSLLRDPLDDKGAIKAGPHATRAAALEAIDAYAKARDEHLERVAKERARREAFREMFGFPMPERWPIFRPRDPSDPDSETVRIEDEDHLLELVARADLYLPEAVDPAEVEAAKRRDRVQRERRAWVDSWRYDSHGPISMAPY